jgi:hypothetical protein
MVDIGNNEDWSISDYNGRRLTTIDGKEYLNQTAKMYYNSNDSAGTDNTLKIPKTKDGKQYSIESIAPEQKNVVLAVIHTIIKFLKKDKAYVPICATILGCGGTGKSYYKYNTVNHKKSDRIKCHLIDWSSIRRISVYCSRINVASFAQYRSFQARRHHYTESSG